MVDHREGIQFVQPRHDISILQVREAADVQNEFRPSTLGGDFIAATFDISIG